MQFSIKEVSERLGCPASTIRYYEHEGLLPMIKRDAHGNRVFEQNDLNWIRLMTCFRRTGMKVSSLKQIVDLALEGESTIPQRKAILRAHQQELNKRQLELNEAFEAVDQKLSLYNDIEQGIISPERELRMDAEDLEK